MIHGAVERRCARDGFVQTTPASRRAARPNPLPSRSRTAAPAPASSRRAPMNAHQGRETVAPARALGRSHSCRQAARPVFSTLLAASATLRLCDGHRPCPQHAREEQRHEGITFASRVVKKLTPREPDGAGNLKRLRWSLARTACHERGKKRAESNGLAAGKSAPVHPAAAQEDQELRDGEQERRVFRRRSGTNQVS